MLKKGQQQYSTQRHVSPVEQLYAFAAQSHPENLWFLLGKFEAEPH